MNATYLERTPYTGPRTKWTVEDGTYVADFWISWENFKELSEDVALLDYDWDTLGATFKQTDAQMITWQAMAVMGGVNLSVRFVAECDECAIISSMRVFEDINANRVQAHYMTPTEYGGHADQNSQIWAVSV